MSYYRINNTDLLVQPTQGRWMPRDSLGIDGNGHMVYPKYRDFEMSWELIDVTSLKQLQDFFDNLGATGTVSVDLPTHKTASFGFTTYSGCVMREPEFGEYFEEHPGSIRLLISRIKTS